MMSAAAATTEPPASKLPVLHVGNYFAPHIGGIETHLGTIAATLAGDVDLRILVANHAGADTVVEQPCSGEHTFTLVRLGMPLRAFGAQLLPGLFAWLPRLAGAVTEIHHPHPTAFHAWLLTRPPGPLVVRYHSEIVRQRLLRKLAAPLLQEVFAAADAIVPTSPPLADAPELRPHRGKVQPIPLGINLAEFAPSPAIEARAAELRDSFEGRPFALLLGRHVPYKGTEVLLAALRGDESLHAVLVGDGPLTPRLRELASRWGLATRVQFVPPVSAAQRHAWLRAADVLVLPSVSRNEAFGLVLLEAFACRTPAVTTALGTGTSWVNRHDETGLVVEPRNPQALAAALAALLHDAPRRQAYGAAAQDRVTRNFDTTRNLRPRTLELYRSLL